MSQNKTVIPGAEYDMPQKAYVDTNANADFYRPSGSTVNSTVISGMDSGYQTNDTPNTNNPNTADTTPKSSDSRVISIQERVLTGVLFSISRGLLGEIFPIYLGRNVIGTSSSADICLREKTVSEDHAILYARCDGYPSECLMTLTDYGSMHGTMVNQQDCRYETLPLTDGDTITIGRHYKLLVKLFDVTKSGLFEDNSFSGLESGIKYIHNQESTSTDFYAPTKQGNNDTRTVIG